MNDSNNTDPVFYTGNGADAVTISSLQFKGPAVIANNGGQCDNWTITNNRFTGTYIALKSHPEAIVFTQPLRSSSITNNDFVDLLGVHDTAIHLENDQVDNVTITGNRFSNMNEGIHISTSGNVNRNNIVDNNSFQKIRRIAIEIQGFGTPAHSDLKVRGNKISDFKDYNDSTFGISVPSNSQTGTIISGNEISDTPRTSVGDGPQIGIETSGSAIVENNQVWGMVNPINVYSNGTLIPIIRSNTLKYYVNGIIINDHPEWHGCFLADGFGDVSQQAIYDPNLPSGSAFTVAFDRYVTGTSSADNILIDAAGAITRAGVSQGSIPAGALIAGRARIFGFENNDTITANAALNSYVILDGGAGSLTPFNNTHQSGNDTLTGNAGTETLFGDNGDDTLFVDMSNASAFPPNRTIYADGDGGSNDKFGLLTSAGADTVVQSAARSVISTINGSSVGNTTIEFVGIEPAAATDSISFDGKGGFDTLTVNSGLNLTFPATQQFQALTIAAAVNASMSPNGSNVLVTRSLTLGGMPNTSKLDLNDNDLIVDYTGSSVRAAIQTFINSARNASPPWSGFGITSTTAKNANPANTTLGVLEASEYKSVYGANATFDAQAIDTSAVLVKYTYYGDTDFNGQINFDDYSRTDAGFNNNRTGWLNGDFDANGVVNFDDYSLIDLAFNTQGGVLLTGDGGGGNPNLIALGQMEHFTERYMWYFIDWNAARGTYYTPEDFFPDGVPW